MKKILLAVLMLSLLAGVATVWATVIGTPHDLAPEPCAMCHTPHSGTGAYPLWNRSQASQTYTLYNSISFDMGPAVQPRAPSSLCLVCHNGIASELVNYPGPCSNPDPAYDIEVAGCADLGLDLSNEHPISFNFNATLDWDNNQFPAASQIRTIPSPRFAIPGSISGTNYWLYGSVPAAEYNYFECATCHSVHDLAIYPGKGEYQVYFLRADNTGSQMCLDCHAAR
ncbi:MAG: hypothetical protein WC581_05275 [Thermodesulfovibrionales bacterium]